MKSDIIWRLRSTFTFTAQIFLKNKNIYVIRHKDFLKLKKLSERCMRL